jgi:uncharacterized DUF497 family protein
VTFRKKGVEAGLAPPEVWFHLRRPAHEVYTLVVYTDIVLNKIEGFEWDAANVGHILRHAVAPFEVEEVASRTHAIIPAKSVNRENRWKLFGKTASGRYLVVVFQSAGSGSAPSLLTK